MKVSQRRCGMEVEAKPVSGQTCPIEPAHGATVIGRKETKMAIRTREPKSNSLIRCDVPRIASGKIFTGVA